MDTEDAAAAKAAERIRSQASYYRAPAGLASSILDALPREPQAHEARPLSRRNPWLIGSALSAAFALMLAIGLFATRPVAADRLAEEVVAGHVRSLMVDHASDVASSDQHTVKPWFSGKLDFSPPVFDLTSQGFALLGGRLDYLDRRPVAAMVYRHRQHLINLFVWPASSPIPTRRIERQGFHLLHWEEAGMTYWAISDLNPEALEQFKALVQKQSAN